LKEANDPARLTKVAFSNLDKVLYPELKITKARVIEHYIRIAPKMLDHLNQRPITLTRFPDGLDEQAFYEKVIHCLLLALTIIYLIAGLGITQYRTIEFLSLGLISKYLSFTVHGNLLGPFVVLLVLHVLIKPIKHVYKALKGST